MLHVATGSLIKTWISDQRRLGFVLQKLKVYAWRTDQQQARKLEWQDKECLFKVRQFGHILFRILCGSACSARTAR